MVKQGTSAKSYLNISTKKGAMFGIDARVAMFIVAILGLIVFPFLTNVLHKSQAEAIINSSKAMLTAVESYVIDTKSVPGSIDNLYDSLPAKASQQANWNGPYLKSNKTDKFVPQISFTTIKSDCTSSSKSSRLCVVAPVMQFCGFAQDIFDSLKSYYSTNAELSYNPTTDCIDVNYGKSTGAVNSKQVTFKVRELA